MTAAGGPAPAFPRGDLERGIPARFERIAAAGPDRLAVTAGDEALTYGAVNATANRLARAIRARSGPAAEPVGLLVDHEPPPWSRSSPRSRPASSTSPSTSGIPWRAWARCSPTPVATLVVTGARHVDTARELAARQCPVLVADAVDPSGDGSDLALPLDGRSLAFVGYTSGSTGEPKGVLWDHRGILHRSRTGEDAAPARHRARPAPDDDRFLELGGHSLIAARIVSEVGTAFGLDITGSALFEAPSVSAMAGVVAEHLVRALPPEARERLFTGLGDAEDVARPAGAAGQSAAAADAPAPAQ